MSIPKASRAIFQKYDSIRGVDKSEFPFPFWDLIVITSSDEHQRHAYEEQLELKIAKGELPKGVPYYVYADPKGPKVGCGGSTLHVIQGLHTSHGEELWNKRVLLINAGGQSQRLPSASVLGKIFTPLPCGNPMYQLLDLKLASYIPFIEKMKPGIFHAAADTLELYDLGDKDSWTFAEEGFTALAHPSSLGIGATHGVYVLDPKQTKNGSPATFMGHCLEVLQKPSFERMREKGAVLKNEKGEEYVYTDSCFYFDHSVSKLLLEFYRNEKPLKCEIDSYGDFLQALGPLATDEYTKDTKNVSKIEAELIATRQKIYEVLKGSKLNILAMNVSKFYHLGTTEEYIHNFCNDEVLAEEMGFKRQVLTKQCSSNDVAKKQKLDVAQDGVIMHSLFHSDTQLDKSAIIEYCQFDTPLVVRSQSLISNCFYKSSHLHYELTPPEVFDLPKNIFMHSMSVMKDGKEKTATAVFGVKDNIKLSVPASIMDNLLWFGKPITHSLKRLNYDVETVFTPGEQCTLWNAKLFSLHDTFSESFYYAYHMIQACCYGDEAGDTSYRCSSTERISIQEAVMTYKDIKATLALRNELACSITM